MRPDRGPRFSVRLGNRPRSFACRQVKTIFVAARVPTAGDAEACEQHARQSRASFMIATLLQRHFGASVSDDLRVGNPQMGGVYSLSTPSFFGPRLIATQCVSHLTQQSENAALASFPVRCSTGMIGASTLTTCGGGPTMKRLGEWRWACHLLAAVLLWLGPALPASDDVAHDMPSHVARPPNDSTTAEVQIWRTITLGTNKGVAAYR